MESKKLFTSLHVLGSECGWLLLNQEMVMELFKGGSIDQIGLSIFWNANKKKLILG
jgi:hypothetical protein